MVVCRKPWDVCISCIAFVTLVLLLWVYLCPPLCFLPHRLEEEAKGVGAILHLEQPEQKGKDDNQDAEPEVYSDALFCGR